MCDHATGDHGAAVPAQRVEPRRVCDGRHVGGRGGAQGHLPGRHLQGGQGQVGSCG